MATRDVEAVGGGAGVVERDGDEQRVGFAALGDRRAGAEGERGDSQGEHERERTRHWQHTVRCPLKTSGLFVVTVRLQPPATLMPA